MSSIRNANTAEVTSPGHFQKQVIHGFNPVAMKDSLQKCLFDHYQMNCGLLSGAISHIRLPQSRLDWGYYNVTMTAAGRLPDNVLTFGTLLKSSPGSTCNGMTIQVGDFIAMSEGRELYSNLQAGTEWLVYQIPREVLTRLNLDLPAHFGTVIQLPSARQIEHVERLQELRYAWGPGGNNTYAGNDNEFARTSLEETMMDVVIDALHTMTDTVPDYQHAHQLDLVRKAEGFVRDCANSDLRLDSLCQATHSHPRTLERAFRNVHGVGPKRFITVRRLSLARQDLLMPAPERRSVTDIAMHWGFSHLSRFAAEYFALFMESPSATLRRGLATVGA